MKELLPCPFCGLKVELTIKRDTIKTFFGNSFDCMCGEIKCNECDIEFEDSILLNLPKVYKFKKAEKEKILNDYFEGLKKEIENNLIQKWQGKRLNNI